MEEEPKKDKDVVNEIESIFKTLIDKDWKEVLKKEMEKVKNFDKLTSEHKIFTLTAFFAIGYLLGSLRRK